MNTRLIAIDIAKRTFSLHAVNEQGSKVFSRTMTRSKLREFIAQQPLTEIVMEACGSAHYWAREFGAMGHKVRLVGAERVKAFVRSHKNDKIDARAIAEAALRPNTPSVGIKSLAAQDIQSVLRAREGYVKRRLAISNEIRGLLAEYGVVIPRGMASLHKSINGIIHEQPEQTTQVILELVRTLYEELQVQEERVAEIELVLQSLVSQNEVTKRLLEIPGIGLITIASIVATVGDPTVFKNGRHFAAFLGLVPQQFTTGGRPKLLGITKRGSFTLRKYLIQGALAVIQMCHKRDDPYSQWIQKLLKEKSRLKVAAALANKNARIVWHLLTHPDDAFSRTKAVASS